MSEEMLDFLPSDEQLLKRHSIWCNFLKKTSQLAEDETEEIFIDNLESIFENENAEETDSEDEQDFVSEIDDDRDTDQIPKAQLQIAINKRVNDWKKNGVDVSMMDNFDISNDVGNFFGYILNNTTVQQSRHHFSICNETANNSKQNQDITKTKLTITVEEFACSSSSSAYSSSSASSMLDSIITHPFFNMSNAFRRQDSHQMMSPLLSSCQNTFKSKSPGTKKKIIPSSSSTSQITKCLPQLKSNQSDLFIFKKPEKPLSKKVKNDKKIDNDNADKYNQIAAAVNKNKLCCDEKLNQKVVVQLERIKVPPIIDISTLKKSSEEGFKENSKCSSNSTNIQQLEKILPNNHKIGEYKKKVSFYDSVPHLINNQKTYPKSPAKYKPIKELIQHFNKMDIESKYNNKIINKKIKPTNSTKNNTVTKDNKMDIESKCNKKIEPKNSTVTKEANEKQMIKTQIKADDKNGLITKVKSNFVDNGANKETQSIKTIRSKCNKINEVMDDAKKCIKELNSAKVCETNGQTSLSNSEMTKSNDKPVKFLNGNQLADNGTKKPEDRKSASKSSSKTSATKQTQISKSKSSSKFKNDQHLSGNRNENQKKSSQQSKERKLTENNKQSKVDSLQNKMILTPIPSISIINSTAIQSDHTMMINKKQFSGNCKNINQTQSQPPPPPSFNYAEKDKYLPIIIYSPTKSLKNKIVDENNKILITKADIESTIGTNYMQQYFGKYEPKIRCNVNNQLIFIPPKPIDTNVSSVDPICPPENRGRIIEKKKKL